MEIPLRKQIALHGHCFVHSYAGNAWAGFSNLLRFINVLSINL